MIAPTIDARNPAESFGPYQPAARPIQNAINAPAIPSSVVMINPPGSFPGIISLAMSPTMNPMIIIPIMCITFLLLMQRYDLRPAEQRVEASQMFTDAGRIWDEFA